MKKSELKKGQLVIFTGNIGYKRRGDVVIQNAIVKDTPTNWEGWEYGVISPDSSNVMTVKEIGKGFYTVESLTETLEGVSEIQMRWCHHVESVDLDEDYLTCDEIDTLLELAVEFSRAKNRVLDFVQK